MATTGQVLDQRGAEGALRAVSRGEEHDRQSMAGHLDGGACVRVRERQIHGVQGRVNLFAHLLFVQRRRMKPAGTNAILRRTVVDKCGAMPDDTTADS
ncbi:hypothetical protein [Streptomyces sp. NPDC058695]|uniref:hypothetical protein n=1 Tax=Streptomyces sp. NPDC058695 TaxID=3346604 RepID=UPI003647E30E